METVSYMIFVGSGALDEERRFMITITAAQIVSTGRSLSIFGDDGKHVAKLIIDAECEISPVKAS